MTKQATQSGAPSDRDYNDGINLPSKPELDKRIAEAFAAHPEPDADRTQKMVNTIMARLTREKPGA